MISKYYRIWRNVLYTPFSFLFVCWFVGLSVGRSVGHALILYRLSVWAFFAFLLLSKCMVGLFYHISCPPAWDLGSHVSGLVNLNIDCCKIGKQGRIHGYASCVWVGRGSDEIDQPSSWAGVTPKPPVNAEKPKCYRWTDRPTVRRTDGQSGL